ncbi:MAG TPA: NfeD family protein [Ilumatobacteraceae bacterium]|nr:NfeD family protein [Ilumatobacteraceae bacterium]
MRRLLIGLLAGTAIAALSSSLSAGGAVSAQDDGAVGPVDVLQVSGLFDDIIVDAIGEAIERADEQGAQALVLQVNSRGATVSDDVMAELLQRIADAPLPIGVWVGPAGAARLYGTPAQILAVADVTGMAPGARVGFTGPPLELADATIDFGIAADSLRSDSLGLSDARSLDVFKQRVSDEGIATVPNMLDALDGYEEGGVVLDTTTEVVTDDGTVQRDTIAVTRFSKLGLVEQLFHTVASPAVAYLLLLIGLALLVFEFYTAGVGIAGVVGAGATILAAYGLAELPTRSWSLALIIAAMVAFAVDVQVGVPRVWTGVGVMLTIIGSWYLFEPLPGNSLRPSWITLIAGVGGIMLTFIVGMPSMVRTRFATPTIGREWMIGELGRVVERVDPDGVVEVREARWRARTNRATPVEPGDQIRVVAIDGVTLEIEPLDGAARDYREARSKS